MSLVHNLQAVLDYPLAHQWVLWVQKNQHWTLMQRLELSILLSAIAANIVLSFWLVILFLNEKMMPLIYPHPHNCIIFFYLFIFPQEFRLNPNAKSFVPLQSPLRAQSPVSDASFYYPNASHMQGVSVGIGVSFYIIMNPKIYFVLLRHGQSGLKLTR